ncbi:MAG TPA: hypothetical protein VK750_04375 [Cytophagaceae bacterium]|jgi:hypothetical protein|nr:hypothetical protein [Cytophagaceae bacterium]
MVKKLSWLFLSMVLIFSTANAQNKKAAKYNNAIIKLQHGVTPDVVEFFEAFEKGTTEDLKKQQVKLVKDFDAAIAKLNAMPDFEGDGALKKAALDWFKLYEGSFKNEYDHIITLVTNRDRSKEDHTKLDQMTDELVTREEAVDAQFETAQNAFSKKHHLEMIEHPLKR